MIKITGFFWETAKKACESHGPAGRDHREISEEGKACESQDSSAGAALAVVQTSVGMKALRLDKTPGVPMQSSVTQVSPSQHSSNLPTPANGRGVSKHIPD